MFFFPRSSLFRGAASYNAYFCEQACALYYLFAINCFKVFRKVTKVMFPAEPEHWECSGKSPF